MTEKPKIATRKTCFEGLVVVAEPGYTPWHIRYDDEDAMRTWLEDWAKEFEDFVRDHRSQDGISLNVQREEYEGCSECEAKWEPTLDEPTGDMICADCGALIEERKANVA